MNDCRRIVGCALPDKDDEGLGSRKRRQASGTQKNPLAQLKALLFRKTLRRPRRLTEDHIRSVLLVRRARGGVLGENLFSEPAWDVLLELYAAELGGRSMTLSDLARATDTPVSVIARWQAALEDHRLTRSTVSPEDPSRVTISLTAEGSSKMEHLANHWGSAFVSI